MTWFVVDDQLCTSYKAVRAGNAAMGLWVRAGSWSVQQLLDGFVPLSVARNLGTKRQCDSLVAAGLWELVTEPEEGFRFHQWEDYQVSSSQVRQRRKTDRDRVKAWRARQRNAVTDAVTSNVSSSVGHAASNGERTSVLSLSPSMVTEVIQGTGSGPARLTDKDLAKIGQTTGGDQGHGRRVAEDVLSRAPRQPKDPLAYILASVASNPERYRNHRGPGADEECPDHPGEFARACRAHAADAKGSS